MPHAITLSILLGSFSWLTAQVSFQTPLDILNSVSVCSDLNPLLSKRLQYYHQHPSQGYKVLIFSQSGNNSRTAAYQAQESFNFLYPKLTYVSYEAPYYKVKVGNFRTHFEASAYLQEIRLSYPNAFVVKETLDIPALLGLDQANPSETETETIPEEVGQ